MRGAVIRAKGGPEVLEIAELPTPEPGPFEVRVAVRASALNRADLLQRRGLYPAPPGAPPDVPGLELAGVVDAVGEHVTRLSVGDPVMAVVGGGACAEVAVVHEREAMRVPEGLDPVAAAAVPEAFLTAWDAAVLQGGLSSGGWLVISAVASGVGTAAIQIARHLGARSIGSSRTSAKLERAVPLGLDVAVPGGAEHLVEATAAATGGAGAHVVLDLVGGAGLGALLGCLRERGVAVLVGLMGGTRAKVDLAMVLRRRLVLRGTVLRSRPIEEKITLARAFEEQVLPLFGGASPRLAPVIDRVLPLGEIARGHALLEANDSFGKIVLDHGR